MLDKEQPETRRTVYELEGVRVETLDNEAVSLYCEGIHRITMTRFEWHNINMALEGVSRDT